MPLPPVRSVSALPGDRRPRRRQKDPEVGRERPRSSVAEVEAHHLVERGAASPPDLPGPRDPGPRLENAPTMPGRVPLELVGQRRARPHERHVSPEDVPELGQLVEARLPEEVPEPRDPAVMGELERARPVCRSGTIAACDE